MIVRRITVSALGQVTFFISTSPQYSFLSSSLVREVARFGGDVSTMVPPSVSERLMKRYQELRALEELE